MYSKNFGQGPKWTPGEIAESTGPVSYLVKLNTGQFIRRHQDHLRSRHNNLGEVGRPDQREGVELQPDVTVPVSTEVSTGSDPVPDGAVTTETTAEAAVTESADSRSTGDTGTPTERPTDMPAQQTPPKVSTPPKAYPKRTHAQPTWFDGPRKKPVWIET